MKPNVGCDWNADTPVEVPNQDFGTGAVTFVVVRLIFSTSIPRYASAV
jgi:hypothetical protein